MLDTGVVYWMLLPFVVAAGSALLGSIIMQARMQVTLMRERESLAEARSIIALHHKTVDEKLKLAEAEARRRALDEFLSDVRVEERHYLRESTSPAGRRKSLVLQERLYFRNIPLSNWVEHETTVEEGSDSVRLREDASVFGRGLSEPHPSKVRTLLR
jgi:hypothetical protein